MNITLNWAARESIEKNIGLSASHFQHNEESNRVKKLIKRFFTKNTRKNRIKKIFNLNN